MNEHGPVPDSPPAAPGYAETVMLAAMRVGKEAGTEDDLAARAGGALLQVFLDGQLTGSVAGLLAPLPYSDAEFEAVLHPEAPSLPDAVPAPPEVRTGLDPNQAVAATATVSAQVPQVEVFSVAAGLRRKVAQRQAGGALLLIAPSIQAFEGDPESCRQAAERWTAFLDQSGGPDVAELVKSSLSDFTVEVDTTVVEDAVKRVLAGVVVEVDVEAIETAVRQVMSESGGSNQAEVAPAVQAAVEKATADIIRRPDLAAAQGIITSALADVTRRADLAAIETAVKAGQADLAHKARLIEEANRDAIAGLAQKEDIATVAAAVREAMSDIVRKVETTAVEALRATKSDSITKSDLEAIVTSVEGIQQSVTTLEGWVRQELAPALAPPEPVDGAVLVEQIARAVADALAPELARPETDPVGGALVAQAALVSAGEQLQIQLEAFNDRIRAGSRSLEALADELSARERSASVLNDALAASVESSLARLADRIDSRFAEAAQVGLDPAAMSELHELARTLKSVVRSAERSSRSSRSPSS